MNARIFNVRNQYYIYVYETFCRCCDRMLATGFMFVWFLGPRMFSLRRNFELFCPLSIHLLAQVAGLTFLVKRRFVFCIE